MSNNKKVVFGVLGVILFLIGLVIGLIWKDLPLIKFVPDLKIYEVFSLFTTIIIGTIYPFLIKKWIEDKRTTKAVLAEEIKGMLNNVREIKNIIDKSARSRINITQAEKDYINTIFSDIDMFIDSFEEQMKTAFPNNYSQVIKNLKEANLVYWKFTSGQPLMGSQFIMTQDFHYTHTTQSNLYSKSLKILIHRIYEL